MGAAVRMLLGVAAAGLVLAAAAQSIDPRAMGASSGSGAASGMGGYGAAQGLPASPVLRSAPSGQGATPPQPAASQAQSGTLNGLPPGFSLESLVPNEFQKFVQEATGRVLPLYGVDFFQNAQAALGGANPFSPVQNTPVSADYPLGPGDEVLIRGWGSIEVDVRTVIDRNGLISIPRVGTVQLAGVKSSQAEGVIRAAIGKYYRDFELNVSFGQLRSITVYVVGQARRPGTYNLSSLSTLVSGLFASGGPNGNGSMRKVQLKRGGTVVSEFDLYTFLAQGNKTGDARLLDGDVIFIPPAFGYVALTGKVMTPGIYEIKGDNESLDQLLAVAGGLPVVADPRKAYLERINPQLAQPRRVEEFALDAAGLKKPLKSGDLLTVLSVTPEFSNAVTLRGNVSQPLRMPWKEGMRIRDLIPSREALVSRASVNRQNEVLLSPDERRVSQRAQTTPAEVAGRATLGGDRESRDSVETLAGRIGNLIDEVNLDYAVVERVNRLDLTVQLIPFNLGRVLANFSDPDNLPLQPGDVITVFSVNDVRVPLAKRRVYVRVEGEVANPGVYQMVPGETLQTLVDKAGGLTRDAYLYGAGFYREEVKKNQAENLEKLVRRLEAESSAGLAQTAQSLGATDASSATLQARVQAAQMAQRQALEQLRSLKPTGRIALDVPPEAGNVVARLPALRLETGDRLVIPNRPDFVYVFGSVNTESALIYRPGRAVVDYLGQSGLSSGADRDNVILVRADGSALTNSSNWGNTVLRTEVMPGDTIVLPEKVDRESSWSFFIRNTKDISQIFYQLGLGAAAIKTLRGN